MNNDTFHRLLPHLIGCSLVVAVLFGTGRRGVRPGWRWVPASAYEWRLCWFNSLASLGFCSVYATRHGAGEISTLLALTCGVLLFVSSFAVLPNESWLAVRAWTLFAIGLAWALLLLMPFALD